MGRPILPKSGGSSRYGGHILRLDDEPAPVRFWTVSLTDLGYHVTAYTNSRETLEVFREAPDAFELVVTDQTMPQLTGETLARLLSWQTRTASLKTVDRCGPIAYSAVEPRYGCGYSEQHTEGGPMAKLMTKTQVVAHLAEKAEVPKKTVASILETLVALATKETKATGQFVFPGLGKAVKAARKARMGRNPQTGEAIKIPAKTVVRFRLAKAFKDAIVPPKKK